VYVNTAAVIRDLFPVIEEANPHQHNVENEKKYAAPERRVCLQHRITHRFDNFQALRG
jgi:hypothetical protein